MNGKKKRKKKYSLVAKAQMTDPIFHLAFASSKKLAYFYVMNISRCHKTLITSHLFHDTSSSRQHSPKHWTPKQHNQKQIK